MHSNYDQLTKYSKLCFRLIGIPIDRGQHFSKLKKLHLILILISISLMQLMQIGFIYFETFTRNELCAAVSFINYFFVGLGKMISMLYNRQKLMRNDENMRIICPGTSITYKNWLTKEQLRIYHLVEKFIKISFYVIISIYVSFPLMQTIYEYWKSNSATHRTALLMWYPVNIQQSIPIYAIFFVLQAYNSWLIGTAVQATDLNLFSTLSLLCMHFEMLAKEISALNPTVEAKKSLAKLKKIAHKHQHVLRLVRELNDIYSPSIIFCLCSESFIICFVSYQMLDELPFIMIVKTFLLLCYESKQVIITCYFGNKLIDASSQIFDALYMHNWYEGSKEYKHIVLFMLMNSVRPVRLSLAGVADVSLITLQRVFSMSYQLFTLLKSSQ